MPELSPPAVKMPSSVDQTADQSLVVESEVPALHVFKIGDQNFLPHSAWIDSYHLLPKYDHRNKRP